VRVYNTFHVRIIHIYFIFFSDILFGSLRRRLPRSRSLYAHVGVAVAHKTRRVAAEGLLSIISERIMRSVDRGGII